MNSASSNDTTPYPGLRPFKQEEAELFFGRESQTNEMLTRLEDHADFRFLAVIGSSGSGKSSLVRAGLLPALGQGFLLGAPDKWKFVTARPGKKPLQSLARAWLDTFHPQTDQPDATDSERHHFVLAQLRGGPLGLVRAYRGERETPGHAILILIDQFEELFRFRHDSGDARRVQPVPSSTQSGQAELLDETSLIDDDALTPEQQRNEAAAFVELLLATARQTEVPMYVVITMRSDFLGDCDAFLGLPEAISDSQYLTPRMTRSQLTGAITGPLELPQFGASIEQTLVTRILNDVGTYPDQLPLMQHALMRTWFAAQKRWRGGNEEKELTFADYSNVDRFAGALQQHLEEAWGSLAGKREQMIAEQLFLCLSERTDEGALIRRIAKLSEVAAIAGVEESEVIKVVRAFQDDERNFIIGSPAGELSAKSDLDISHEALLRQWARLGDWIENEANKKEVYRLLANKASLWNKRDAEGRRGADMLQGRELERAQNWERKRKPTAAWAKRYQAGIAGTTDYLDTIDYLEKSSQAEAKKNRRARIKWRFSIAGFAVTFVSMAVLTAWALWAQHVAEHEKTKANLRERAAMVKNLLPDEPVKALVLAIHAAGEDRTRITEENETGLVQVWPSMRSAIEKLSMPMARENKGELGLLDVQSSLFSAIQVSDWLNLFNAYDSGATSVAISPDGETIVSGGSDGNGTVRLWDLSGNSFAELPVGHTDGAHSVAFSPDGKTIVSGGYDGTVRLWDLASKKYVAELYTSEFISSFAISPDGEMIVSGDWDGTVQLWDLAGNSLAKTSSTEHTEWISSVVISPDGETIVSGSWDGTVRLWDRSANSIAELLTGHTDGVSSVAISPDGETIVSGGYGGTVSLWDRAGKYLAEPLIGHEGAVNSVAIGPDGEMIVSGGADGSVRLWDRSGNSIAELLTGHTDGVSSVAISSDGKMIVSGGYDGSVSLRALNNDTMGRLLKSPKRDNDEYMAFNSIAISPDGEMIVGGGDDGSVRLWDRSGNSIAELSTGHDDAVSSVAISPDGKMIVSGGTDGNVSLWDRSGNSIAKLLIGHEDVVNSVAISPDGKTIVSSGDDGSVRLWDRAGTSIGEPLEVGGVENWNGTNLISVAISPDGKTIVSGGDDGTVWLWKRNGNGTPTGIPLTGHEDAVNSVAISPDGKTIVSGSSDKEMRLWVCEDKCEDGGYILKRILRNHDEEVTSVAFSADGQHFVSGSVDATVWLWHLNGTPMGKHFQAKVNDKKGGIGKKKQDDKTGDLTIVAFISNTLDIVTVSRDNKKVPKVWRRQVGKAETWLPAACESLRNHDVLVDPDDKLADEIDAEAGPKTVQTAAEICLVYGGWEPAQKTEFLDRRSLASARAKVREGEELAREGKLEKAIFAFHTAQKFEPGIDLDSSTEAIVLDGRELAEQGDVEGAIATFKAAQELVSDIDLEPDTETIEKDPDEVARQLAAPAKVRNGRELAEQGDAEGAIAAFQAAQKIAPNIDLDPETETIEKDPGEVARQLVATAKVRNGRELAEQGDVEGAIAAFQAAQKIAPNIDLDQETEIIEKDPGEVARQLAAPVKVRNGRELAEQGDVEGAIAAFQAAQELVSDIDLAPETETIEKDPGEFARQLVATAKVRNGRELAEQGDLEGAIAAFQAAQELVSDIDLAPETETIEKDPGEAARQLAATARVRNGRELAEQGDLEGAIAAFQAAQKIAPNIDLDPNTGTIEKDPGKVALQFATGYAPKHATGAPNTPEAGDFPTAWSSKTQDDQSEWLELEYEEAVLATAVEIHETYNPGAVIKVSVYDSQGKEVTVWEGIDPTPQTQAKGVSKISIGVNFSTKRVKLYIDSPSVPGWNDIDAVGLNDAMGNTTWAARAKASSTSAGLEE